MSLPKEQAWFPTKTYGYGWGVPQRWQGWVVLAAYFAVLPFGYLFLPDRLGRFIAYTVLVSLALVGIAAWKGERPRWRWGDSDKSA